MLVSSIGYFDAKLNNNYADNSMKNQQTAKTNLSEGFGQYGKKTVQHVETPGFIKTVVQTVKSMFNKNKMEDNSKYLSLIA